MEIEPLLAFGSAFGLSAFAGLSALLGFSRKPIQFLTVFSSMLHGGLMGLAVCLWWYNDYREEKNVAALIGLCIFLGLGGFPLTTLLLEILGKGGVNISFSTEKKITKPDSTVKKDQAPDPGK